MSKKFISSLLLATVFIAGIGFVIFNKSFFDATPKQVKEKNERREVNLEDKFNLVVLGSDAKKKGLRRSDTIMVASFNLETKQVGLLSIPRDTRVKIPGYKGYHKINAAYSYGGLDLTIKTIEDYLKIPLDYHLQIDYQGFVALVNTLGGIEINVEKDLHYVDQAAGLNIDIEAGQQKLTGQEALEYVRFRHDALGDIGRIRRQQKFLKAASKQVLSFKTLLKTPELISKFREHVVTDLEFTKLFKLATIVDDFQLEQVVMKMLPGSPEHIEGISYWLPDLQEVKAVVASLIKTKSYFKHQQIELTILNGNGTSGLAARFADLLSNQGYRIKEIGNADNFKYTRNIIIASSGKREQLSSLVDYLDAKMIKDKTNDQVVVIIGEKNIE
ncbi:cell envelope-related function transcriptional attenuator common domain protein [Halobacteroides halobius DSM 5150]|uniref:Cell envelope-related function transcriptional attenuator common domain protein n=1 Tax=Halobacteroides halobius (strain ATCC 35273 / DSM 5150 / MD-1) TaxID=748449 RepID=L0KA04_HALHC|nr:LCP family protein [Halobacteroides halobius]AGB41826.1 cell envelope-related function transcriptional attenuator common domain protein [Halobacteroides halobius DSM 5150]